MEDYSQHKILSDTQRIAEFVRGVRDAKDTPWLIQWVAEDTDRMVICAAAAAADEAVDPAFYKRLVFACQSIGYTLAQLIERIGSVAKTLGIGPGDQTANFYQVLGVPSAATEAQIRSAYREKARQMHPDTRSDGEGDTTDFVALSLAYNTLGDPFLRRQYDQKLKGGSDWHESVGAVQKLPRQRNKNLKYIYICGAVLMVMLAVIFFADQVFINSAMEDSGYERQTPPAVSETGKKASDSNAKVSATTSPVARPSVTSVPGEEGDMGMADTEPTSPNLSASEEAELEPFEYLPPDVDDNSIVLVWWLVVMANGDTGWVAEKRLLGGNALAVFLSPVIEQKDAESSSAFVRVSSEVKVNAPIASLRIAPSLAAERVRDIRYGEIGVVVGGPKQEEGFVWWKLQMSDQAVGWAVEKQATAPGESAKEQVHMLVSHHSNVEGSAKLVKGGLMRVDAARLSLRSAPRGDAKIIRLLTKNEQGQVIRGPEYSIRPVLAEKSKVAASQAATSLAKVPSPTPVSIPANETARRPTTQKSVIRIPKSSQKDKTSANPTKKAAPSPTPIVIADIKPIDETSHVTIKKDDDRGKKENSGGELPRFIILNPTVKKVDQNSSGQKASTETGDPLDLAQNPPNKAKVQAFLDRYAAAYASRSEKVFVTLFAKDAKDNNRPLEKVLPSYRRTFGKYERIEYGLKLVEYSVDVIGNLIRVKGEYAIKYIKGQNAKSNTGRVEMVLTPDEKMGFLVKRLRY